MYKTIFAIFLLGWIGVICQPIENNRIDEEVPDEIDLSHFTEDIFGTPDTNTTGTAVAEYNGESNVNPEELGSYVEGDILFPSKKGRNGLIARSARWPGGIVPFVIEGHFNNRDQSIIEDAIREYHRSTCIRFKPRSNEHDYLALVSGNSGCWSAVGKIGGRQEVNLQSPGCLSKPGTAIHELMHAMGFLHEQNRYERDTYVTILHQNIQPDAASNFEKASPSTTDAFGVPYDYGSVMHYSANAFSRNGQPTIVPNQSGVNLNMGQRDGFSRSDIAKINSMYDCDGPAVSGPSGPGPVYPSQPPRPQGGGGGNLFLSFLGGLANGLGLGDEEESPNKSENVV